MPSKTFLEGRSRKCLSPKWTSIWDIRNMSVPAILTIAKNLDKLQYPLYTVKKSERLIIQATPIYRFLSQFLNLQKFFRRAVTGHTAALAFLYLLCPLPVMKLGLYFSDRWHILSSFRGKSLWNYFTAFLVPNQR